MGKEPVSLLLVSDAGPVQEGLWDLLSTLPEIQLIHLLPHGEEILRTIRDQQPRMIVLDTYLRNHHLEKILKDIRALDRKVICIAIVHEANQKEIACMAGADEVQISGFPAGELAQIIHRLLEEHKSGEPCGSKK